MFYLCIYGKGPLKWQEKKPADSKRDIFNPQSYRQDSTYHDLCYISSGVLAGTKNSSVYPSYKERDVAP